MLPKKVGEFDVIKHLGAGTFGNVYLVSDKTGKQFAAKVMNITEDSVLSQVKEALIQIDLDHKYLLKAHKAFVVRELRCFVILMDHCEQGSLASLIGKLKGKGKGKVTQQLMLEIAHGVRHLHRNKKIVHRDLKPENILMKDGHPMISDYGLSKYLEGTTATYAGTPFYNSPQLEDRKEYGFGIDIWSLGIVFLDMLKDQRMFKILKGAQLPCRRQDFPSQEILGSLPTKVCRKLIVGMLQKDPEKRMKIKEVVKVLEREHLFFEDRPNEPNHNRTEDQILPPQQQWFKPAKGQRPVSPLQNNHNAVGEKPKPPKAFEQRHAVPPKKQQAQVQKAHIPVPEKKQPPAPTAGPQKRQPFVFQDQDPSGIYCKQCGYRTKEILQKKIGKVTWYWFVTLIPLLPLSFLPFVLDRCKDDEITCQRCKSIKVVTRATCW